MMTLKKKSVLTLFTFGLVFLFALPVFAEEEKAPERTKADTNREVAVTYAQIYLEQKLYDEAEATLQLSLKNDGENGEVLNLLGLIQLQQKNYSQACYSFQKAGNAIKDVQNRIYALYNLADCLNQGGRNADAVKILKDLMPKEEGVSDSAEKALELMESGVLRSGSALPPYAKRARGKYRLTGALSSGFDTNVLLVEEAVASGTAIKDRGSFYYSPVLQFGYLGRLFGEVLDARFVSAYTSYLATNSTGYNNLYSRIDLFLGAGPIKWGFFSDLVFLNSSTFVVYNYDIGLLWQRVKKISPNEVWIYEVPFKFQKFVLSTGSNTDNDRTGGDVQIKLTRRYQWNEKESFSITGNLDNQYTTGRNYRLSGLSFPVNFNFEAPFFTDLGFTNSLNAELSGQLYWQSELNRRDYSFKLGTGVVSTVFQDWNLNIDYYYLKSNSNVDAATYSKGVVSLLLSHHFI